MKTKIIIYSDGVCTASGSFEHLERQAKEEKPVKFAWLNVDFPEQKPGQDYNGWQLELSKQCRIAAERAGVI